MPLHRLRPEDLKPGPIRHQQLPPELMTRIESLRSTLDEVYPMSMGEWLDGFQRDAHPEQEVIWWERLARCYVDYSSRKELNAQQRRDAFRVICGLALGSAVEDVKVDLAHLAPGALDEIFVIMRTVLAP